jgi:hypothetical protein
VKGSLLLIPICLLASHVAQAYQYPLQFTPNPGYRGLVVAGYKFENNSVVGVCSYYTTSGNSSGKGGGYTPTKRDYKQTCHWDLYGNLLSIKSGEPAAPAPLYTANGLTVYAVNNNGDSTGVDHTTGHGFVNTPGSHYTWVTPSLPVPLVSSTVFNETVLLKSDGDVVLTIDSVEVSSTNGVVTMLGTSCNGQLPVGATCSVQFSYNSGSLTSATGRVNDTVRVELTSDAGEAHDFVQKFITLVPKSR